MDPSLGARLRAQRERQQIALSTISEETKIKVSMLEGLERDDVSQWPEGIFRRAYVRAYARAVGLDPEALVREFLELYPDPVVAPEPTSTELEDPHWPAGLRRLVTSAMAAVPSRRQRLASSLPADLSSDSSSETSGKPEAQPKAIPVQAELNLPSECDFSSRRHNASDNVQHRPELSLQAAAELCTKLGRILDRREIAPILEDAATVLAAVGLIVWTWDSRTAALRPSLACGYPDAALARMRSVRPDADNAVARAFQSARACRVDGSHEVTGAVVVPLIAHRGCAGVLAVELRHGDEQREDVRALATILAAQLVTLVESAPLAEAVNA